MSGTGKPIVVGVDGSHPAQLALRWALTEAMLRGCGVRAVHAWSPGGIRDFVWTSRRVLRAESQALLRTAVAAARRHTESRVEVITDSVEGPAAPALVTAAQAASLLVLGVHAGRRGPGGLGLIGAYCAHRVTVPLVIVPVAATSSSMPRSIASASRSTSGALS